MASGTSCDQAMPAICAAGSHDIRSTLRSSWKFGRAKMQLSPDQFAEFARKASNNGSTDPRENVPLAQGPEEFELPAADGGERDTGDTQKSAAEILPFKTFDASQWEGVPIEPRRWIAHNRIPVGEPGIMSGDGGTPAKPNLPCNWRLRSRPGCGIGLAAWSMLKALSLSFRPRKS
jgi:hypothetical protein